MTTTSSSGGARTTADREIVMSRVIGAPRELVFEAFTRVRHLARWWGPEGFTTTTRSFEFRVAGVWDFVMRGPDGTDYQEWITWQEIVPPERIALLHGEFRGDPNAFESVLTFEPVLADEAVRGVEPVRGDEAVRGDEPAVEQTRIVMCTVFPSRELRDEAVEKYHAIEGGEQTLHHLADYVAQIARERLAGPEQAGTGRTVAGQETERKTGPETGQEGTVR